MIFKYVTRTTKLLEKHDEARTVFVKETRNLEKEIEKEMSDRCMNSFILGMSLTALAFSVIMWGFMQGYGEFAKKLMESI